MKFGRIAVLLATVMFSTPAWSQEAGLDASSKAAYEASIVAMSEGRDPAFARGLILSLLELAAAEPPSLSAPDAMRLFAQSPEQFYARLKTHEGKSADELIAAADAL